MKRIALFLGLAMMATLMVSCGNNRNANAQTPTTSIKETPTGDDELDLVDWDKPSYLIENGDTISVWWYGNNCVYCESNYGGIYEEVSDCYDELHRPKSYNLVLNSGNIHYISRSYTYNPDKTSVGEGTSGTEGYDSFTEFLELGYYLDDDCLYDTLIEYYEGEVYWEDAVQEGSDAVEQDPRDHLELQKRVWKRYETTGDGFRVKEKLVEWMKEGKFNYADRTLYAYDAEGRLEVEEEFFLLDGESTPSRKQTYEYDANGHLVRKMNYSFGEFYDYTLYEYLPNGLLLSKKVYKADGMLDEGRTLTRSYDGNCCTETTAEDVQTITCYEYKSEK